jgi:hypothetical protein
MVICSTCGHENPDDAVFCANDGARLDSGRTVRRPQPPPARPAARTDEPARSVAQLQADLAERDARIRQLEQELDAIRGGSQAAAAGTTDATDRSSQPAAPAGAPEIRPAPPSTGSERRQTTLDPTEVVPTPTRSFGWLVCVGGLAALIGKRYEIRVNGLPIGRAAKYAEQGGISIKDKRVSNPHAWIGVDNDKVFVRDEGSTNGTFLKDLESPVVSESPLAPGDTIIIAEKDVAEFVYMK